MSLNTGWRLELFFNWFIALRLSHQSPTCVSPRLVIQYNITLPNYHSLPGWMGGAHVKTPRNQLFDWIKPRDFGNGRRSPFISLWLNSSINWNLNILKIEQPIVLISWLGAKCIDSSNSSNHVLKVNLLLDIDQSFYMGTVTFFKPEDIMLVDMISSIKAYFTLS